MYGMLEGPISTGFSNKLNNFDSNNGIPTSQNTILIKQNQMWTSKKNIYIYIYIYIYIHIYVYMQVYTHNQHNSQQC